LITVRVRTGDVYVMLVNVNKMVFNGVSPSNQC